MINMRSSESSSLIACMPLFTFCIEHIELPVEVRWLQWQLVPITSKLWKLSPRLRNTRLGCFKRGMNLRNPSSDLFSCKFCESYSVLQVEGTSLRLLPCLTALAISTIACLAHVLHMSCTCPALIEFRTDQHSWCATPLALNTVFSKQAGQLCVFNPTAAQKQTVTVKSVLEAE